MHGKFGLLPRVLVLVFSCAQCCSFSVIHRTLTWTTGSLKFNMCRRSFLCVRKHTGVGHIINESAQHFDSEKLSQIFDCAPDGVWTSGLWIQSRCSTNWATPSSDWSDCHFKRLCCRTDLVKSCQQLGVGPATNGQSLFCLFVSLLNV